MSAINGNFNPMNPVSISRQEKTAASAITTPLPGAQPAPANGIEAVSRDLNKALESKRNTVNAVADNAQARNDTAPQQQRRRQEARAEVATAERGAERRRAARENFIGGSNANSVDNAAARGQLSPREQARELRQGAENGNRPSRITDLPLPQPQAMAYNLDIQNVRRADSERRAETAAQNNAVIKARADARAQNQRTENQAAQNMQPSPTVQVSPTAKVSPTAQPSPTSPTAQVVVQAYRQQAAMNSPIKTQNSPALQTLQTPPPQISTSPQQAAMRVNTQNLQAENNTLTAINNTLGNINNQVQTITVTAQNSLQSPSNAPTNQRTVNAALDNLNNSVGQVQTQSQMLRRPDDLSELNAVLRNLGSTPPPASSNTDNGRPLTLQDLRENGRAPQATAPELAATVSQNAAKQLSATRNTVETMQSNVLSATGAALENTIIGLSRAEKMPSQNTNQTVQTALKNAVSALETTPTDAVQTASNNLRQERVAELVRG